MADKYQNYEQLRRNEIIGVDYQIRCIYTANIAIVAPHGGKIEPGTTDIAEAVADSQYSLYSFEGLKKNNNYKDLHITSTRFDEPLALELIREANRVITIHGVRGKEEEIVYLGGLDDELKQRVSQSLLRLAAEREPNLQVKKHDNPNLQGINPCNICNRGKTGKGVQLEITRKLRDSLRQEENQEKLKHFAAALTDALSESS